MQAKIFFVFFFVFCSVISITVSASSSDISSANRRSSDINANASDIKEEVLLAGTLGTGMIKSLTIIPFDVWKSSMSIEIDYLSNLSNITVEIKNDSGQTLHHSIVNPVSGGQLIIDIQGWASGNYTITFTNGAGGCVYGAFTI